MRWAILGCCVAGWLVLAGCGGGGSGPSADAGGYSGPPGAPPPPGAADDGAPMDDGGASADAVPMESDYTPPGDSSDTADTNENYVPPSDAPPGDQDGALAEGDEGEAARRAALARMKPKTLREQAFEALHAGRNEEGFRLLYTHFLTTPGASAELAEKMAWIGGLRRPALGPRIGVAALYLNPPRDFQGSPQPVGSPELASALGVLQQAAQRGRDSRSRRGQRRPAAAAGRYGGAGEFEAPGGQRQPDQGEAQLLFHTGDFGDKLLDALEERIESGAYGAIYREIAATPVQPARRYDPNNPEAGFDAGALLPGAAGGDTPPDYTPPDLSGAPGEDGGQQKPRFAAGPQSLGLAITWVGKADSREELAQLAEAAHVDCLVTFEIEVRPSKTTRYVGNFTKVRASGMKKDDQPFISNRLENRVVAQAGEKGGEMLDKEVARVIEALDKLCQAQPLPAALTAEVVKRRVASLVAERPADPLPAVIETRYYAAKGLLPDDEATTAMIALLGEDEYGRLLASAPSGGMAQWVGGALSLQGLLDAVHGVNAAAAGLNAAAGGSREKAPPAKGSRLKGLLPFGGSGSKE